MAPLPPSERRSEGSDKDKSACTLCIGVSVYSKAMADERLPPRCDGIEVTRLRDGDFVQQLEENAGKVRDDNFTLYGLGFSIYSPEMMAKRPMLPVVRGLGVMVLKSDPDELMRRMEEHKRVRRELEKDATGDGEDKDDDIIEDLGDDRDDMSALLEKGPLGQMPSPPRMPPLLPTMSFDEFVTKSVDHSKTMVLSMYNFWARRLDGFGERYQESCRRLLSQMEKQFWAVPHNIGWMGRKMKELEEQARRGGGSSGL